MATPGSESAGGRRVSRRAWGMATACAALVGRRSPADETDAGRDRSPPSPGGVRTGVFGLEARGNRFVYVFDRSASMGEPEGRPLAAAKRELLRSIDDLGEVQQFSIIFYNDRLHVFSPTGGRIRQEFATEDNRRAAGRFVAAVRATGGTRHAEALAAAFRLDPDAVFLLTDADAKDDLTAAEVERLARLGAGTRCLIGQFGDDATRSPGLADLAARCGGTYRTVTVETAEGERP